jgi:hypothetical protein
VTDALAVSVSARASAYAASLYVRKAEASRFSKFIFARHQSNTGHEPYSPQTDSVD